MNYQTVWLHLGALLLLWGVAISLAVTTLVIAIRLRAIRQQLRKDSILLELTPPPAHHNTQQATEEFFRVLNQIVSLQSWRDLVSGSRLTITLEVISTAQGGIRYLVRLPRYDKPLFLHNLSAFAPTVTANQVSDYMPANVTAKDTRLMELRQTGHRSYSLRHTAKDTERDPIAYLTNAMGQLDDKELIALQIVLSPASSWHVGGETPTGNKSSQSLDFVSATERKSHQPLFHANIRVLVHTATSASNQQRVKGIRAALATFAYDGYQSLAPRLEYPHWLTRYRLYLFRHRLPALFRRDTCLLASDEVAALYHFPYGTASLTEDLVTERNVALPLPLAVKNQKDFDIVYGENIYRGRSAKIGLTAEERQRHVYVVGGTGNGKTTLLQYAIVQDMRAGKGMAILDPHGDMAETLLRYVPEDRMDDVIYFNPSDLRYPIGLNVLELPPDLAGDDLLHEKDLVTESIVSMFRKIFATNASSGHRIEYVLRNAIQTALTQKDATLFTVYDLLNDSAYRRKVVSKLTDKDLKLFWREFNKAGSYQQVSMAAGITAKIGRFLFSASARRIIEQPVSTINFDALMQSGKILICNVSKGQLGEDTSELFGIMVLTKLQLATLRRAQMPESERRPFHVYVDEFQNFATPSFVQLLSEARKYGLFLTMAEQSTAQQSDPRIVDIIFANVGTVICFRTSSQRDEQLLQPLLSPHVSPGTISTLPAFTFYMRIASILTQPPFSGRTVLLGGAGDTLLAQLTVQASRMKYARAAQPTLLEPTANGQPLAINASTVIGTGSS